MSQNGQNRPDSKRSLEEITSSPLSSKPSSRSQTYGRKRKCPLLPKQQMSDDDLEIITVDDDGSSPISRSIRFTSSSAGLAKKGSGDSKPNNKSGFRTQRVGSSLGTFNKTGGNRRGVHDPEVLMLTPSENHNNSSSVTRSQPLLHFNWADCREVWENMLSKDESYVRNPNLSTRHPSLQMRMRSILLDWLSEVSEVYKLHRETYYLAIDFIDRFLSKTSDMPKQELQLMGITCLFVASKIEEIYPPKLQEFAYVTDGACSEEDILEKELILLKALNWDLTPMTVNAWLQFYLQLYSTLDQKENNSNNSPEPKLQKTPSPKNNKTVSKRKTPNAGIKKDHVVTSSTDDQDFMIPGYPGVFFSQIAHLLDLAMLDAGCLQFNYSAIAASALFHFTNTDIVYQCTGLKANEIKDVILWMTPFAIVIRDEGFDNPKFTKTTATTDNNEPLHNLLSHTADLTLLEKAHEKWIEINSEDSGVCLTDSSLDIDPNNRDLMTTPCSMLVSGVSSPFLSSAAVLTPPKSVVKTHRKS